MTDFSRKILARQETRAGAGTYTLDCGHQVAVTGGDWQPIHIPWYRRPARFSCPDCKRNAEHEAAQ